MIEVGQMRRIVFSIEGLIVLTIFEKYFRKLTNSIYRKKFRIVVLGEKEN
jgi:hypothetical protein